MDFLLCAPADVFGCLCLGADALSQTPNWQNIKPSASPTARADRSMAYDSARQRTVLFGGLKYTGSWVFLGDTWEWDGRVWKQIKPNQSPISRHGSAMVYDSARQRVVLFGGRSKTSLVLGETWEYDGKTWTQRKPRTAPLARYNPSMVYDSFRQRVVLFGG